MDAKSSHKRRKSNVSATPSAAVTRRVTLAAWGFLGLAAVILGGCAERDFQSIENSLWKMFRGQPKPIILKAPKPVYCVETIGQPDCYDEPPEPAR
jgi:hypothetical protein